MTPKPTPQAVANILAQESESLPDAITKIESGVGEKDTGSGNKEGIIESGNPHRRTRA